MANKQTQKNKAPNLTAAQAKVVAEREKRLAEALRENLKRRKSSGKLPGKLSGDTP